MRLEFQESSTNFKGRVIANNIMPKFVQQNAYSIKRFVSSKPYDLHLNYDSFNKLMHYNLVNEKDGTSKITNYVASCRGEADFIAHLHMASMEYEEKNKPLNQKIKDSIVNFMCKYILKI